jgi:hypothetical protein
MSTTPEREMVRRALVPGAVGVPLAFGLGLAFGDGDAGWSAALGVGIALANFAAHGVSLSWASTISVSVVHAVALGGVVIRLGTIVGLLFLLDRTPWFSPLAFGLAVVPATLGLLAYEAKLMLGGLGGTLQVPADPAARRASERLAARESSGW